jgi:CNT family concentrative nucleoside transporter
MLLLRALLGLAFFVAIAWLLSNDRKRFPTRVVVVSLLMQFALALFILRTPVGLAFFEGIAAFVTKLIGMAGDGTALVFGGLAQGNFAEGGWGFAFAFASSGLPVIIFFSALMAVLYHIGVMQVVIYGMARVMTALMGVSGAESMSMAANVFVGQTEAPLVVRPYIASMTRSELNALMTGGFATIAGSVLAVYMGLLGTEYGPHLITASVMSAPAAFLIAKIILPEREESVTGAQVQLRIERSAENVIEAAANGTADGLKLWLNVIAMLIAFMGLVALVNWPLGWLGEHLAAWGVLEGGLSLGRIFGWIFAPVAWFMGVEGWHDCQLMGTLLGTKIAVNEFIAFDSLQQMLPPAAAAGAAVGTAAADATATLFQHARSAKMAAYALCGFANFASIGIQIGGISPLAPERKPLIAKLALRAMIGGAFASWMTATVAGAFL